MSEFDSQAAERLCKIYFEIAAEVIGEVAVRAERDRRIGLIQSGRDATPPTEIESELTAVVAEMRARLITAKHPDHKLSGWADRIEAALQA